MAIDKLPEVTDETWLQVNKVNRKITEEFLEQGHLSPQTLKQYRSGLRQFFKWVMNECDNRPVNKLKPKDAISYQNYLKKIGLSPAAIKFKRASVSSLCGYVETFYLEEEGFENFRNIYNKKVPNIPKQDVREKKPLVKEEYEMLLKTLEEREEWQMIAYVKFTYSTGCRRAESRQLKKEVAQYNKLKDKSYYLTHEIRCKGRGDLGKPRKLVFDDIAMDAIKKWLEIRGADDCPHVFVSRTKVDGVQQISETTFNYWCSKIFSKIVGRRVHPHQFREQRATDLVVGAGKDIKTAQALLGHESSTTTEIYVIRESNDDVDDAFGE